MYVGVYITKLKVLKGVICMSNNNRVEWMCSYCGMRMVRDAKGGRPMPGTCNRKGKTAAGKTKPHSWVVSRRF